MAAMPNSPFPNTKGASAEAPGAEGRGGRWPDKKGSPDVASADLVGRIDEVLAALKERPSPMPSEFSAPVGGIEARVAHVEATAAHLQRDVAQIRTDVREIRERLSRLQERAVHLPSKGLLALSVFVVLATVLAAAGFQQQIQAFLVRSLG